MVIFGKEILFLTKNSAGAVIFPFLWQNLVFHLFLFLSLVQCAAVITCLSETRAPPHQNSFLKISLEKISQG